MALGALAWRWEWLGVEFTAMLSLAELSWAGLS